MVSWLQVGLRKFLDQSLVRSRKQAESGFMYIYGFADIEYVYANLRKTSEEVRFSWKGAVLSDQPWVQWELVYFWLRMKLLRLYFDGLFAFWTHEDINDLSTLPPSIIPIIYKISGFYFGIHFSLALLKLELINSSIVVINSLLICFFF